MNADAFAAELGAAAPSQTLLKEWGLDRKEVGLIRASFVVRSKGAASAARQDDPLIDLIARFDASPVTVGKIRLAADPEFTAAGVVVGVVEADHFEDYLLVEPETGKVEVREQTSIEHLVRRSARDGGRFLDALLRAAMHFNDRLRDRKLAEDPRVIQTVAEQCARLAGGLEFAPFYEDLFEWS